MIKSAELENSAYEFEAKMPKPVSRELPCRDKLSLWQSDAIAAPAILRQLPCPLSHLR